MNFENLEALFLLAILPGLYFLYLKYNKDRKSASIKFSSLHLVKKSVGSQSRKHIPFVFLMVSVALIVIGLTDPQLPTQSISNGANVVIVLDGSESMIADDYSPTRFDAAKSAIGNLVTKLNDGDSAGIVLFGSGANTASYLSPYKEKTLQSLNSISEPQGATALGDGIVLGVDMASSNPERNGVLIVLSDGIHNSGFSTPAQSIEYAKKFNIRIHAIGMGSQEPVFVKNDVYGQPQFATLDENTLQNAAQQTGGKYFKSIDETTLNEIFSLISQDIRTKIEYESFALWFFVAALILIVISAYVVYGKLRIIT